MKTKVLNLDDCVEALAKIVAAVQHKSEQGCFPAFPGNKSFEQWSGDLAAKALRYSAVADLDKFL